MIKKILSLALTFALAFACAPAAYAENPKAKLYGYYGDGMLFKQNEEAVLAGTGKAGNKITSELYDAKGKITASGQSIVSADGTFTVSFTAPSGSYEEYSIVMSENETEFARINNVVFGELWLASGQSNMQYPLAQSRTGRDMSAESKKLSKWLRVLLVPPYPEYNGSTELVPADPQQDITDAEWVNGENSKIYGMSAVAYFFAVELMKELDMPVGILNSSLGGSAIRSWLSRETIDGNENIKNDLISGGNYIEKSDWNEAERNIYQDMTANYNQKIEPLKNFRISGMIWYQGETDLILGNKKYAEYFDLMQNSYTELFKYKNGLLPIVYTQIASYHYSDNSLDVADWNMQYTEMQKQNTSSRAMITIYDVPLTFTPDLGLIHPECKEEVGERMAIAAKGLVYGKHDTYSAATVENSEIRDGCMYLTLENIGSGLKSTDSTLNGFAICGKDGIYVQANAEIINSNTVKVWSESITEPCAASYAYCNSNQNANLYASVNGEITIPVAPFVTDPSVGTHYWHGKAWADCKDEKVWYTENDTISGYYDTWTSETASINFSNGLNITSNAKEFSISPLLTHKDGLTTEAFRDVDTDYSDYGTVSFYICNNGNEEVIFKGIKFYKNSVVWYSPAIGETKDCETVIPADGKQHIITLNLNRLYLFGNEGGISQPNEKISEVKEIEFSFKAEKDTESNISIDEIRFTPSDKTVKTGFDADIGKADNVFELFSALIVNIIGLLVNLF